MCLLVKYLDPLAKKFIWEFPGFPDLCNPVDPFHLGTLAVSFHVACFITSDAGTRDAGVIDLNFPTRNWQIFWDVFSQFGKSKVGNEKFARVPAKDVSQILTVYSMESNQYTYNEGIF